MMANHNGNSIERLAVVETLIGEFRDALHEFKDALTEHNRNMAILEKELRAGLAEHSAASRDLGDKLAAVEGKGKILLIGVGLVAGLIGSKMTALFAAIGGVFR